MATINLWEEYNSKVRKFGINDLDRFRDSFLDAVNLTYADLNAEVFQNQTLAYINSFDDVIDNRLRSFATITYVATAGLSNTAISGYKHWSSEWELDRVGSVNGITDTFTIAAGDIVISILNGVFSFAVAAPVAVTATYTLPDEDSIKVKFEVNEDGNTLYINDSEVTMTYSVGTALLKPSMGTVAGPVTAHVISGTSGYILKRTAFYSTTAMIYEFLLNEGGVSTALVDEVSAFTATALTPVWQTVYIQPSSSLDSQYKAVFNDCINYYLQEGGEWAIEPDDDSERKWLRAIKRAKKVYQNNTTYTNPLGL